MAILVLGDGCFWGMEGLFRTRAGVTDTRIRDISQTGKIAPAKHQLFAQKRSKELSYTISAAL